MMDGMSAEETHPGLDPQQSAAVRAPRGPVCVLAGAGTGKTRTITRRIAHLVDSGHVSAGQVLAVTFTARAAGEMRARLRDLGVGGSGPPVQARTFHAAALRQLKYFWPQVVGDTGWQLLDRKFAVVGSAAGRAGLPTGTEAIRDLASEIEWAKASLVAPEDYARAAARLHREVPFDAEKVAQVYAGYEQLKTRGQDGMLLDFDDLLLHTAAALEEHSTVAEEFRDRYRCFVVDEYQDVTPLQQRVLDAWLGDRDDLTVVGDANQTIYSFTGATPAFLLDFSRRFPDATVVRLERDYRSTPEVVSLANRVIGAARGRIAGTRLQLIGQREAGPEPEFAEYDDEPAEAAAVAKSVRRLIASGVPASEIAILYRINAQSEVHEEALTRLEIPYQVRGGEGFFTRTEVRQAVNALRQAGARGDLPDAAGADLVTLVRAVLAPLGLTDSEPAGAQARERWASLTALIALTEELLVSTPELTLDGLLRELSTRAESRHPPVVQGVTLASLHAAKGLEWDAVFLVGLTDGTLPIQHVLGDSSSSPDEAGIEEERRLLYVGVTRAREHLHLSWALARNEGGRKSRRRSRFLHGLIPDESPASRIATPPASTRKRPRCRVCGKSLIGTAATMLGRCEGCPSNLDEDLLIALKEWRREKARELKVPAYVVFSDNTLTAIAEQCPGDDRALVAIPGIGAKKLETYGGDVLSLVRSRIAAGRK
ncbi:ATP-dependent DNA helicase UvrD2 [Rhodococcus triatomae]|uniref:ATP-dependent DNA helicase UvrD2 n=1 Tax=Rhodococcus triatomae TaxID=300028 RepID=A0A1G8F4A5_9NOCA|nr:ATP-dependent DNA helicase UvrD2 [Rhodococcus triatomae]QNG19384.1 ATP-dependent DNA helicase UvrD2 [Rhodococcus triatomae]QNG24703.1 ATP-dependent DNA helicase UvrD2 [Rhodococcus triatomae]SDH76946.1 DNA helicase-2 / ATP-dependent DNA helicase PcrA [Rhodococcus triatomae]